MSTEAIRTINNIKLSIAIPTYNGSLYICEALDSIILNLENINDDVEIVISDNASIDQTPTIIKEYQKKYDYIHYFRNDANLGADRNFDLAIKRSRGEYIWLLGDDDKLKNGAIKKVLEVLKRYPDIGFIWVNYGLYNEDLKVCIIERRDIESTEDFCCSADEFYRITHIFSTTCSTNIVKRSSWISVSKDRFMGSSFIHVGVVSSYLIKGSNAYCINYPYLMIRIKKEVSWVHNGTLLIYSVNYASIIKDLIGLGYKKSTVKKVFDHLIVDLWKVCISAKLDNLKISFSLLKAMMKNYGNYYSFWCICLPLLLLPNKVYKSNLIKHVYRIGQKQKRILLIFHTMIKKLINITTKYNLWNINI